MNCDHFELLMAEALGDELAEADRPAFEGHLALCERCREEYRTALATLRTLRSLPGPDRVSAGIEGKAERITSCPVAEARRLFQWSSAAVLRYAASVLIAFTAGYAVHAGLATAPAHRPFDVTRVAVRPPAVGSTAGGISGPVTFGAALAGTHLRNPGRSDLANCMIAMFQKGR